LPKLVLEWEEAQKGFESIAVSKYTVKIFASYTARKFLKLWQHKIGAVQELFPSRLGGKKVILQVVAPFSNRWVSWPMNDIFRQGMVCTVSKRNLWNAVC